MSPNPKSGEEVRVPCRQCNVVLIKIVARAGTSVVTCPACQGRTEVRMETSEGALEVRTSPEPGA